jgi:hypothetical protein
MSDQSKLSILKRELDSIRRRKWLVIVLWWIVVFIFRFYLNLEMLVGTVYGFVIGATLATVIWYYYTKKEKQIRNQIAQLKI